MAMKVRFAFMLETKIDGWLAGKCKSLRYFLSFAESGDYASDLEIDPHYLISG